MAGETGRVAAFYGPGKPMVIKEYAVPSPEPGAAVVRTSLANICGSDLHQWRGEFDVAKFGRPYPQILGHEMAATVYRLGDGVTRDTVLQLAHDWKIPVEERLITVDEVITAAADGRLSEAFGTGTAAVVSPVSGFVYKGEEVKIGDGKVGPLAQRLFDEISDIQRGLKPDPHGWVVEVDE